MTEGGAAALSAGLAGAALGFSLILAIGAQNAFVLRQGLKKQQVFLVCLLCATSDALLIAAGVSGFGALVKAYPAIETIARYGGAAFLAVYGGISLIAACRGARALRPQEAAADSPLRAATVCLALTWLNPHVYLDTVVLLGSVSTQYAPHTLAFGTGAALASYAFFFGLGYGAALLRPLFSRPRAWQILDALIALVMFSIAAALLR